MKITLVMVMSVDGRTTRWGEPQVSEWTSREDQEYFFSLIQKQRVIIMGRKTFEASKTKIKLSTKTLRIVITKDPDKYRASAISGLLEFTSDGASETVLKLQERGYNEALLVGGGKINSLFLKEGLVDELWITVEPIIFGEGNNLVVKEQFNINLQLKSIKKLNSKGTVLLKYKVMD